MNRRELVVFILAVGTTLSTGARAQEPTCTEGYEQGQVLRKAGKLLDARKLLRVCVNKCTRTAFTKACGDWLHQVEGEIPTVVLWVKEADGTTPANIRSTLDGNPLATRFDGRPIEVDPGSHTFAFTLAGRAPKEVRVMVPQGAKNQLVSVTLATPAKLSPPASPTPAVHTPSVSAAATDQTGGSAVTTVGWTVAGVGVVGLGIGGFFGWQAISKNNDAGCDSNSVCTSPELRKEAQSAGTASTVGLVAGGLLVGGGVALVLLAPKGHAQGGTHASATPWVSQDAGGWMVSGRW